MTKNNTNLRWLAVIMCLAFAVFTSKESISQSPTPGVFSDQTPAFDNWADGVSYELGLKFTSAVDGRITAIRYWKAPSETPSPAPCVGCGSITHTGKIWTGDSANPTTLGLAYFMNETASGWQQAQLAYPIFIQRGQTYIVSVETNTHYAATNDVLVNQVDNGNLIALQDGGVYGPKGQKPSQSYRSSHYFRDVVFEPIHGQTIFGDQTPERPDVTDGEAPCVGCVGKAYELGTRFVAAVDGEITGIRYWRAPSETIPASESTGNNTGRIWSENGVLLATVAFDYQWPRSGWHYAYLSQPLPLQAGKAYTVSVYTNSHYAYTGGGLSSPVTNGDLTALASGGVYGNPGAYPTSVWQSSHYSRDVLFKPVATIGVTTNALPGATIGQSYSASLTAIGGTRPYTWSVASGALPAGVTLATDGTLSGSPTVGGVSNVTFTVTDANNRTATSGSLTLTVVAPLTITTPSALPAGTVGQAYNVKLNATGGNSGIGGYWWSFVSGNLISGLSLTLDGSIVGTPRTAGNTTVTLRIRDSDGKTADATFTLTVQP
jgi:hypothetical protein